MSCLLLMKAWPLCAFVFGASPSAFCSSLDIIPAAAGVGEFSRGPGSIIGCLAYIKWDGFLGVELTDWLLGFDIHWPFLIVQVQGV